MASTIVLTVGMNPLPILVASFRLWRHFQQADREEPSILAVVSANSEAEAQRVKQRLETKLEGARVSWIQRPVPPGDPEGILAVLRSVLEGYGGAVHLHYTGGTKAMAAHAMQALSQVAEPSAVSTSYLDVNEHRLRVWNLADFRGPADERKTWPDLTPRDLAELHGMTFVGENAAPDKKSVALSESLYDCLTQDKAHWIAFDRWKEETLSVSFKNDAGEPWDWEKGRTKTPKSDYWPKEPVPWLAIAVPGWDEIPSRFNAVFPDAFRLDDERWQCDMQRFEGARSLGLFLRLLFGGALEFYVYAKVRELLPDARHSFKARSASARCDCEIDVVACLGYQLLAISCTEAKRRGLIKSKAFEVWHRARQIGGDGARALLICPYADIDRERAEAQELEEDVADNIGLHDPAGRRVLPVRVFGFDKMRGGGLSQALATYLEQDLNWPVNQGAEA